uniref:Band 7 domain-containing protein n=1 Tax=Branchiostoma floridae TaxID=7739 RepID=C3ZKW0_BRAFL|eukprot:XP_002590850.1 hypothetical protein BRAFLDRAFT_125712 [Branchiostoma floridae]
MTDSDQSQLAVISGAPDQEPKSVPFYKYNQPPRQSAQFMSYNRVTPDTEPHQDMASYNMQQQQGFVMKEDRDNRPIGFPGDNPEHSMFSHCNLSLAAVPVAGNGERLCRSMSEPSYSDWGGCCLEEPRDLILTKDSVTVSVDAVVYFRVSNATISVANVENANQSTRLLAQTTLRNILGTKNLTEILSDRENISHTMQSQLDEATDPWGIKVERVEIKDVRLPVQLQRAMAAEAEAAREARAKVIAAEGEMNASRALKEAADVIAMSPSALQLRYLQTLTSISAEKNSTIIFPLPIDLINNMMKNYWKENGCFCIT